MSSSVPLPSGLVGHIFRKFVAAAAEAFGELLGAACREAASSVPAELAHSARASSRQDGTVADALLLDLSSQLEPEDVDFAQQRRAAEEQLAVELARRRREAQQQLEDELCKRRELAIAEDARKYENEVSKLERELEGLQALLARRQEELFRIEQTAEILSQQKLRRIQEEMEAAERLHDAKLQSLYDQRVQRMANFAAETKAQVDLASMRLAAVETEFADMRRTAEKEARRCQEDLARWCTEERKKAEQQLQEDLAESRGRAEAELQHELEVRRQNAVADAEQCLEQDLKRQRRLAEEKAKRKLNSELAKQRQNTLAQATQNLQTEIAKKRRLAEEAMQKDLAKQAKQAKQTESVKRRRVAEEAPPNKLATQAKPRTKGKQGERSTGTKRNADPAAAMRLQQGMGLVQYLTSHGKRSR
eukprot:TRINITY_DN82362_c0_g1_i1.p1 TRINITY_DN82362_c0_g1~~TRINITY_DN82362_c0_g1_i1.p1  ORF type:complete len:419 (+),score=131.94 TRINITY_DN82362_c0_g1_i1:46-1302(+)